MASERGNPHARIDDVRSDGTAWSLGNEVTPLVHGATYFRRPRRPDRGDG
ncbi:MAG: hypothetical protein IPM00_09820 [Tetrasphaera sp.]|nr:hypothetical protein [Tetrasphaera sp.]